jgi:hypothetical protein
MNCVCGGLTKVIFQYKGMSIQPESQEEFDIPQQKNKYNELGKFMQRKAFAARLEDKAKPKSYEVENKATNIIAIIILFVCVAGTAITVGFPAYREILPLLSELGEVASTVLAIIVAILAVVLLESANYYNTKFFWEKLFFHKITSFRRLVFGVGGFAITLYCAYVGSNQVSAVYHEKDKPTKPIRQKVDISSVNQRYDGLIKSAEDAKNDFFARNHVGNQVIYKVVSQYKSLQAAHTDLLSKKAAAIAEAERDAKKDTEKAEQDYTASLIKHDVDEKATSWKLCWWAVIFAFAYHLSYWFKEKYEYRVSIEQQVFSMAHAKVREEEKQKAAAAQAAVLETIKQDKIRAEQRIQTMEAEQLRKSELAVQAEMQRKEEERQQLERENDRLKNAAALLAKKAQEEKEEQLRQAAEAAKKKAEAEAAELAEYKFHAKQRAIGGDMPTLPQAQPAAKIAAKADRDRIGFTQKNATAPLDDDDEAIEIEKLFQEHVITCYNTQQQPQTEVVDKSPRIVQKGDEWTVLHYSEKDIAWKPYTKNQVVGFVSEYEERFDKVAKTLAQIPKSSVKRAAVEKWYANNERQLSYWRGVLELFDSDSAKVK